MAEKLIWRYATVIGRSEVEIRDLLNQAGYDGWELVSANCLAGMEGVRWIAFVKLPVRIPDLASAIAAPAPMSAVPGAVAVPGPLAAAIAAAAPTAPAPATSTTPPPAPPPAAPASVAPPPAANADLERFGSMEEESVPASDAVSDAKDDAEDEPLEIHGDDFDFSEVPPTATEGEDVLPSASEEDEQGPEFDLGATPEEPEKDTFHLTPEQQAILTGGSLMSLDDFPVEFSLPTVEDEEKKKEKEKESGTMMSLDDFPSNT